MIVKRVFLVSFSVFSLNCFLLPARIQILISPGGNLEEGFEARGRIQNTAAFVDGSEAGSFDFGSILAADIANVKPENLYYRVDVDKCIQLMFLYGPLLNNILDYKESAQRQKEEGSSKTRASVTGGSLAAVLCEIPIASERSESSYE